MPELGGLELEVQDATRDRLAPEQIPPLLAALRAGDDTARIRLQNGLRHLLYQDHRGEPLELYEIRRRLPRLGAGMMGIITAVNRLRENDEPNATKYVRDEIWRATRDYWQIESRIRRNIEAESPYSTNWDREKRGEAPYEPLKRETITRSKLKDGFRDDSPLEVPRGPQEMPIEFAIANELAEQITHDEFERDVLELLKDGYTVRRIAATLAATKHKIETTIRLLRERAAELLSD